MELGVGQDCAFLSPPPIGGDINDLIVIFENLIEVAGVPSVMRGTANAGDSGYLANQLRAAAEMSYKLAMLSLQRQLEKAMEFTHWMITNVVQQTVYVLGYDSINPKTGKPKTNAARAWLGLSPDRGTKNVADLSKLAQVSFSYRPTLPTDEQARAMIALQLTNAANPLYSVRDALETWLQEEDPESVMDRLWVEKALASEPLNSMMTERALSDAGLLPIQPPQPAQAPQLVGPDGMPIQSGMATNGPISPGMQGVPLANQAPPGMAGVPGLTMPLTPPVPQGIPGGGAVPGMYPGMPGGPNL
jgi:hypothetical protein